MLQILAVRGHPGGGSVIRLVAMARPPGDVRKRYIVAVPVGSLMLIGMFEALAGAFVIDIAMSENPVLFPAELSDYCRQHHIRRLSLFGSHARGTAHAGSDIDLLVEFDGGMAPGLIGLAAMESELSVLMGGRKIDLRTPQELSRHFRDQVVANAIVQYVA